MNNLSLNTCADFNQLMYLVNQLSVNQNGNFIHEKKKYSYHQLNAKANNFNLSSSQKEYFDRKINELNQIALILQKMAKATSSSQDIKTDNNYLDRTACKNMQNFNFPN